MAAGLGYKEFATGDVLTAADANGYLASQVVMVFASAAARTSAIASPQEGMVSYLKDTNSTEYYSGSAWVAIGGSSTSSFTSIGSAALTGSTTITVSGLSGYNSLFVTVDGMSTTTNYSFITFKFNSASANHYAFGNKNQWQSAYGAGIVETINQSNVGAIQFGRMPNNVGTTGNGTIKISGANTTAVKPFLFQSGFAPGGAFYDMETVNGGGYFNAASVISSISLISAAGNFDAGTITVYGSVV
jgi:hypothetical protein